MRENKRSWFIGAYLLATIIVISTCLTVCSCKDKRLHFNSDRPDSVYVAKTIEATVNPSFSSIEAVKVFQARLKDELAIDHIFTSLPVDVLDNVVTVCLKQQPSISKKDIVAEYRAHKEVYDNLSESSPDTVSQPVQIPPDTSTVPKNTVTYKDGVDTVNGKLYKVRIREEKMYE